MRGRQRTHKRAWTSSLVVGGSVSLHMPTDSSATTARQHLNPSQQQACPISQAVSQLRANCFPERRPSIECCLGEGRQRLPSKGRSHAHGPRLARRRRGESHHAETGVCARKERLPFSCSWLPSMPAPRAPPLGVCETTLFWSIRSVDATDVGATS